MHPESDVERGEDPAARALFLKMNEALRQAETLQFESHYRRIFPGRSEVTARYKAWLKKPNHFRIEGFVGDDIQTGVLIGDGSYMWVHWPHGRPASSPQDLKEGPEARKHVYLSKPAPPGRHSLGHDIGLLGANMNMTIVELSSFHGYTDTMEARISGFTYHGHEMIGGERCDVIEVAYLDGQRTRRLWLSPRDGLPRKLKQTVHAYVELVEEETWVNVTVNGPVSEDLFAWVPPAGWRQWFPPEAEEALLSTGTLAPDFELKLATGKSLRLSDFRGKVVVLCIWRVGCPPCLSEIIHLEQLHKKHAGRDLAVIGFDCVDEQKFALEALRKYGITFACILDSSKAAIDVGHRKYRGASSPTTYVIDKEGRVAASWLGYSEDDNRLSVALKGLGIKWP